MLRSALACVLGSLVACSGDVPGGGGAPQDDGGGAHAADAQPIDAPDAATRDAAGDARPPSPPACSPGDREEWSGTIPNTLVQVAVCSTCGESYVSVANGNASPADVTVDNGTKTITTTVAAGARATTPTIADKPGDGSVTVCRTSGHAKDDCLPVSPTNERYCNPLRAVTKLKPERIDQGVDYAGAGPIYAIGPGVVDVYRNRNDSGWPGGTFVSYKLTAGPAAGKVVFLAENVDLDTSLHSGSHVFNGTVLGTLVNAYPNCETGWGVQGAGYTAEHSCYVEGCATALGMNFNDLLVCLKAPSGVKGSTGCCTSSAGYPSNWCQLLSAWQ